MSVAKRLLVLAAATVALLVIGVAPAWADHAVSWGRDSPNGRREITAEGGEPVDFEVSVTLNGAPLPDHSMTANVYGDRVEPGEEINAIDFATNGAGIGGFTVSGVPADELWVVQLCDADGCLYGDAGITGTAAPEPEPESEPEPAATAPPTTTGAPPSTVGDDSGFPWIFVAVLVVGLLLVALGGWMIRTRGDDEDGEDEEDVRDVGPPLIYGEEISATAHTDILQLFFWKTGIHSKSLRRGQALDDRNQLILKRNDKPTLLILLQVLEAGKPFAAKTILFDPEKLDACRWEHNCAAPQPSFVYSGDKKLTPENRAEMDAAKKYVLGPTGVSKKPQVFQWHVKTSTKALYQLVQSNYEYRLVGAVVVFTPIPEVQGADAKFWTALNSGLDAAGTTAVSGMVAAAGTALAGPLGGLAASIATTSLMTFVSNLATEHKVPQPFLVRIPDHTLNGAKSTTVPVTSTTQSPAKAKLGSPPELWLHGTDKAVTLESGKAVTTADILLAQAKRGPHGTPDRREEVKVYVSPEARILVRRAVHKTTDG